MFLVVFFDLQINNLFTKQEHCVTFVTSSFQLKEYFSSKKMRFLRLTFSVIFPFLVNAQDVVESIYYLASTEADGRLAGSKGEEYARKYLVKSLEKIGLTPLVDSFIQPFSFVHTSKKHAIIQKDTLKGVNIIGYIDNQKQKTILIGAHYDHLGKNEYGFGRFEKETGKIHYGADDNASGVAGVLRLAQRIVANQIEHEANYIIAFFSGEEFGLHGSNYLSNYLKQENIPIEFMLNFDMIGRLNPQKALYVEGLSSSRNFDSLLTELNSVAVFQLHKKQSAIGTSDHTSFYLDSIPVLAFSSGVHSDYHTINDTPDKINYTGIIQIVDFTYQLFHTLEKTDLTAADNSIFEVWLIRNDALDLTKIDGKNPFSLTLYPNPTDNKLTVSFEGGAISSVNYFITALDGKIVQEGELSPKSIAKGQEIVKVNELTSKQAYSLTLVINNRYYLHSKFVKE